ncbi:hypothetical protein ASC66_01160 [Leifsonia sp. Root4]|uniref:hypothetical protein n=1 Tax=Leifsonia sp. Root4 TaxID=1736525 RepID=UPI0006FF316C|nr:hypothetical protein [Leifsonia sp. Root4]KQW07637.1 hypothetical protein ASC66_01160 [Leifsonia sp. Root4]
MTATTFSEMDMFLARLSLDPPAVEAERYRMPSLTEAPGSPDDRRMRREHRAKAAGFWLRSQIGQMLEEASGFDKDSGYKKDPARFAALVEERRSK